VSSKVRRSKDLTPSQVRIGGTDREGVPRFLAYALPRGKDDDKAVIHELDDLDLHDVPLRHADSFLAFDGVVVLAGVFEKITIREFDGLDPPDVRCATSDLDRREREFYTLTNRGQPFVFLVQPILHRLGYDTLKDHSDLFRRVISSLPLEWDLLSDTAANLQSRIPEFRSFVERYGAASVWFQPSYNYKGEATIIAGAERQFFGFEIRQRVFFLPCHKPQTHDEAVQMAADAARAVIAYRRRMSEEMPEWAAEFQFTAEVELRDALNRNRKEAVRLEGELDAYTKRKGALCFRSEPLVDVVVSMLASVFGLRIESEEQCVEDARVLDMDDNIIAVVEIKGISGSFTRQHVNQVDSHRERLKLPSATPALLIMNTKMAADSLAEKDEAPHPDIIKKAVQDNVLLVRTLDLLRYADLVESGTIAKDNFRTTILSESGWLRVEDNAITVLKE